MSDKPRDGETSLLSIVSSAGSPSTNDVYKVYPTRWWILFVMSLLNFSQCLFWLSFSPVSNNAISYFGVSDADIAWWLNMGPVAGVLFQPFASRVSSGQGGLLQTARVSAIACAFAMVMRLFPALIHQEQQTWAIFLVYVAQFINGMVGPLIMGCAPMLSAQWFADDERTLATAIAVMSNTFGSCGGFFLAPWLVHEPSQTVTLMWVHAGFALFNLVLVLCYFPSAPKTPPSVSSAAQLEDLKVVTLSKDVLIRVMSQRQMQLLATGGGVLIGIQNVWCGSFNQILPPSMGFDQTTNGLLGVGATFATVVSGLVAGYFVPRSLRSQFLVFFTFSCLALFAPAAFALPLGREGVIHVTLEFWPIVCLIVAACCMLGGLTPLCYELAAEACYPASESISGGIIVFLLNSAAFVFLFALPPLMPYNVLNMLMLGGICVGVICFFFVTPRKRVDVHTALLEKP